MKEQNYITPNYNEVIDIIKSCNVLYRGNDNPVFVHRDFKITKDMIIDSSASISRDLMDEIHQYICNVKMYKTKQRYPFLIHPEFVWKENIIYSSAIRLDYIYLEDTHTGPLCCVLCKLNLNIDTKYFSDYCSCCKKKFDSIIHDRNYDGYLLSSIGQTTYNFINNLIYGNYGKTS